jgi:PTH1 family peptidyl-tRNA hydrolase
VRIGVGRPQHANEKVVDYVLHRAGQDERISIDRGLDAVVKELPEILSGNLEKPMQRLHTTDE